MKRDKPMLTHTVQSLQARCVEFGNCWLWQGGTDSKGRPQTRHAGKVHYVRRLVRSLTDGAPLPVHLQAAATCGTTLCVSPHCSVPATPTKRGKLASARGAFRNPVKLRRMMATKRARSPFNDSLIARVRAMPPPCSAIAAATGISVSHVKAIRRSAARRDLSNPFNDLLPACAR